MARTGSVALRQQLVGRRITNIRMNPFENGRGGQAHNFEIMLDNGTSIFFTAEETDTGDYGVYPRVEETRP